ncbi:MAG: UbiD family decarboxylase [Deferrisomatales bacterium]|nr:UbiD family decarboxylase [Deferrisomatales bacterium]
MPKDLQGFLERLEQECPEALLRVPDMIDPNTFEATAFLKHLDRREVPRAVLFEQVKDLKGADAAFRLAFNLFVTRSLCARALDMSPSADKMELTQEFARREGATGETVVVPPSAAPCRRTVLKGAQMDLRALPVPMHHQLDVGPYLTMVCTMKSPKTGAYDMTFTKNLVKGRRKMSISAHHHHHLRDILGEYEEEQRRAPVVVILGHHPAFFLSTCCLAPYGNDDYGTASAFLDEPLRLTASETWGGDFLVPADAEIIIEGEIPLGVLEAQNPFGEILGYYQPEYRMPVIEVTAITYRDAPIMQGVFPGHAEHFILGGLPKEGSVFSSIRKTVPGVRAVHLPDSGCGRVSCYIALRKESSAGDVRKAAMQAFVEMPNLKLAVVVDEDVDVYNERDVMWAVTTRTWWDRDLQVIDKVQSFRKWLGGSVAIIDATRPKDCEFPTKNEIPQAALDRIQIDKYL